MKKINPYAKSEAKFAPWWYLENLTYSYQCNMTVVFLTLTLNNLGFRDKRHCYYIYFRFFATDL